MQRFIAELTNAIGEADFGQSWQSTPGVDGKFTTDFHFDGRRVLVTIESGGADKWRSDDFYRTFSSAIRRVDQHCNIRWL
jgi:hypothetical protein